jgi:membrane associated rhomboid family serine protease
MLERALGRWRFGLIYAVALMCGSLGVLLYGPEQSVGASGAVFGLMGAAAVVARNRGLNLMESGLGLWLGINILITFTIPNISIGAHLGGLVGGAIAAFVLVELGERRRLPPHVPELLCAALGVGALIASFALYA